MWSVYFTPFRKFNFLSERLLLGNVWKVFYSLFDFVGSLSPLTCTLPLALFFRHCYTRLFALSSLEGERQTDIETETQNERHRQADRDREFVTVCMRVYVCSLYT